MSGVDSHPIIQSLKKVQEFLAKNDDKKYHRFYNAGYLMEHKYTPRLSAKLLEQIIKEFFSHFSNLFVYGVRWSDPDIKDCLLLH